MLGELHSAKETCGAIVLGAAALASMFSFPEQEQEAKAKAAAWYQESKEAEEPERVSANSNGFVPNLVHVE